MPWKMCIKKQVQPYTLTLQISPLSISKHGIVVLKHISYLELDNVEGWKARPSL